MLKPARFTLSRLGARQTTAAEHPDAYLLQTFCERKATAKERSAVVSHLAQCADCREVVSLLASSREREQSAAPSAAGFGIAWSRYRWTAAALAAVCLVLVFRREHDPAMTLQDRVAPLQPQLVVTESPSASLFPNVIREEKKTVKVAPKPPARLQSPPAKPIPPPPVITLQPTPNMPIEKELELYNRANGLQVKQKSESEFRIFAEVDRSENTVARETALLGGKEPTRKNVAAPQALKSDSLIPQAGLYSLAPHNIARRSLANKAFIASPAVARWSLTKLDGADNEVSGTLYRSQDEGRTWTPFTVAPGTPLTALATQGSDIWAGGKDGALYHSSDDGNHWAAIAVSNEGERLTLLITRIETPGAGRVILKTHSGPDWISVDNGQHWAAR